MLRLYPRSLYSCVMAAMLLIAAIFLINNQASAQILENGGRLWTVHGEKSYCPDPRDRTTIIYVHDAATNSKIRQVEFTDQAGNPIQVLTGLAFDDSRRN